MATLPDKIGFYFDEAAYEGLAPDAGAAPGAAAMITGRHVASKSFLDAYLEHGRAAGVAGIVTRPAAGKAFAEFCRSHPSALLKERPIEVIEESNLHGRLFPEPPATLLHFPYVPPARIAWAREHGGPASFSISGVTHAVAAPTGAAALCELVTAPFEPYDALVCTSRSMADLVRATTGAYAEHLRARHGGHPTMRARLETIPSGVDTGAFRPASPAKREATRQTLGIADDEVAVLFVGRLSLHAKSQPYPLFDGLARAVRSTGRKVHLVLSGWAAKDAIRKAIADGARVFAPNVRVTLVDGASPDHRYNAWHAADLFASFADSLQESVGLAIGEAMACGLPVVAADWGGARDRVVDGETGLLVPTSFVRGATPDASSRLVVGEVGYDQFLAECNQATVVDLAAAAEALRRMIGDDDLRRKMGAAGRERAMRRFDRSVVVGAYERLWEGLERDRRAALGERRAGHGTPAGPACYPAPESAFAGFPSAMLDGGDRVVADEHAAERLKWLIELPLTNYMHQLRSTDRDVLRSVLAAAKSPRTIDDLGEDLAEHGVGPTPGRATLGWMLKYGLLRVSTGQTPVP